MAYILSINFLDRKDFLDQKTFLHSKLKILAWKNFFRSKNNFFRSTKIFEIKKMDIGRRLFNDQHPTTTLIALLGRNFFDDCV